MTVDNGFEETAFENGREAFWQLEGRFFMRLHENHETSTFNLTQMNFRLGQDIVFNRSYFHAFMNYHELLRPYQFNIRNSLRCRTLRAVDVAGAYFLTKYLIDHPSYGNYP